MTTETVDKKFSDKQKATTAKSLVPDAGTPPLYIDLPLPGDPPQVPDQNSTDYRTVSQKTVYYPEKVFFNLQKKNELRKVTVSGVKLVWETDDLLRRLSGQLDLVQVVIVADSVEINIPVKLPQSKLEIYARELIFGDYGSIDVTPLGFEKGVKPEAGHENYKNGKYTGITGTDGMPAQSIDLHVKTLYIPDSGDQIPEKRLIARGSRGQDGGVGGFLDLEEKPLSIDALDNYYETNQNKLVPPKVAWENIKKRILSQTLVVFPIPIPTNLGSVALPRKKFIFEGMRSNNFQTTPKELTGKHVLQYDVKVRLPFGLFYNTSFAFKDPATDKKPIPLNGLNAYPYGRPGHGGKGGQISFFGKLSYYSETDDSMPFSTKTSKDSCSESIHDITDVTGGKKGESEVMKGARPALDEAVHAEMALSFTGKLLGRVPKQFRSHYYPVRKFTKIEEVKPRHGDNAEPPEAKDGDDGEVTDPQKQSSVWIHEFNAEAALTYAKHACMLHSRKLSHRVAQIYFDSIKELPHPLPPRLAVLEMELDTLLRRLQTDLDIFGNQLGWVPHLSVISSFEHLNMMGLQALETINLCDRMKKKWDVKESKLEYLTATRKTLTIQLDEARRSLVDNHTEFSKLGQKVHEAFLQKSQSAG